MRAPALLWVPTALASLAILLYTGRGYALARAEAASQESGLRAVAGAAEEMARLRAAAPEWTLRGRPAAKLTPRVTAVLASCGLPASTLSSLSPETESVIGEGDLRARRQRATLALGSLTLPQVGKFLAAWRQAEPRWTIVSIDLGPGSQGNQKGGATSAGGDLPVRAVLALETIFTDDGGAR